MDLKELITKIEQWAIDRELDKKATVEAQSIKTSEEMAELIIGISKDNIEVIKDSIGDVFVTLVIGNMIDTQKNIEEYCEIIKGLLKEEPKESKREKILSLTGAAAEILEEGYKDHGITYVIANLMGVAEIHNLDFKECVQYAYDEIKDRKGKTIDGCFIKEEDLK